MAGQVGEKMEKTLLAEWEKLADKADNLKYMLLKYSVSFGKTIGSVQKEYHTTNKKLDDLEDMMEATGKFWFRNGESPVLK